MSIDRDLGALICMLNPYTNGQQDAMDPHVFVAADWSSTPTPAVTYQNTSPAQTMGPAQTTGPAQATSPGQTTSPAGPASTASPTPAPAPTAPPDMTGVWIEEDKQHPHWEFKQQPHRIAKAVRIAYRWPYTVGTQTVWITDYVLVGFEGSNGG
ncbi:MAG TPA: hypothetical protein VMF05_09005 [Stellaceae bacterium]|nr:hypothetical protein [Stellaceae bacterium]